MLTKRLYDELEILSRHIRVLETVMKHQPIGIVRISNLLGLGEHEVRHSLGVLENEGLIKPTPNGAILKPNAKDEILRIAQVLDEVSDTATVLKKELLKLVI